MMHTIKYASLPLLASLLAACGGGGDPALLTPSLTAQDQTLDPARALIIQQIVSPVNGFLVVREDNSGTPGALLASSQILAGTTVDLVMLMDRPGRNGEVLHAILHGDTGKLNVFEYDEDTTIDAALTNDSGDIVKAALTVTVDTGDIGPEVRVDAQTANPANTVVVALVRSAGPGFIVIHEDSAGSPGAVIGNTGVDNGDQTNVQVTLNRDAVDQEVLHAMLHTDDGALGVYEFDGLSGVDDPAIDKEGQVVTSPFVVAVPDVEDVFVLVNDQPIAPLNEVVIQEAVAYGPGFIVIHADDGGQFGAVLGHASLSGGSNADVRVQLQRDLRNGEALYAMLHVDSGVVGQYEFDGQNGLDAPATNVAGDIVAPRFVVSFEPAVVVIDQVAAPVDRVRVASALIDGAGWLVIHADNNGPGPVIGKIALTHGLNEDLSVELDRAVVSGQTLYAMLHTDDGVLGTYEFDGSNGLDGPVRDAQGNVVAPPFVATFAPQLAVRDQPVDPPTEVYVQQVTSVGPGFVVIHESSNPGIGGAIGFVALANGTTSSVAVTLDRPALQGETLYAMLHRDTGIIGAYEFTGAGSPDGPVSDDAGNIISPSFTTHFPEISVQSQTVSPTDEVLVESASLQGAGFVVIHADSAGGPGAVLGNAAIPAGTTTDVRVLLVRSALNGERLHAMLHWDRGQPGVYEANLDAPAELDGAVVSLSFIASFSPEILASNHVPSPLDTVTIDRVVSEGPGWVVIRESNMSGGRGSIIGSALLSNGSASMVSVQLDREVVDAELLHAILHRDLATLGVLDGSDPIQEDAFTNQIAVTFTVRR